MIGSAAFAEPITVRSGLVYLDPFYDSIAFELTSASFHFGTGNAATVAEMSFPPALAIEPGRLADPSSHVTFDIVGVGSGDFHFSAVPALLTCFDNIDEEYVCQTVAAFTFSGSLMVPNPTRPGIDPNVQYQLTGQGRVHAQFCPDVSPCVARLPAFLAYEFQAPVPEPGTLMLLAGGLVGSFWRRRTDRGFVAQGKPEEKMTEETATRARGE